MAEHTKGPWKAIGKGGTHDGCLHKQFPCFRGDIMADNGQVIVKSGSLNRLGVQGATPQEAEANAHLIGAAPETAVERDRLKEEVKNLTRQRDDLLEACKVALEQLEEISSNWPSDGSSSGYNALGEKIAGIEVAIARAETRPSF